MELVEWKCQGTKVSVPWRWVPGSYRGAGTLCTLGNVSRMEQQADHMVPPPKQAGAGVWLLLASQSSYLLTAQRLSLGGHKARFWISRSETRKPPHCTLSLYNLIQHLCLGPDVMMMVAIEILLCLNEANPQTMPCPSYGLDYIVFVFWFFLSFLFKTGSETAQHKSALNLLHSLGWLWTYDSPDSTSQVLALQGCPTTPGLCGGGYGT